MLGISCCLCWWVWAVGVVLLLLVALFAGITALKGKHRAYLIAYAAFITVPLLLLNTILRKLCISKRELEAFYRNDPVVQLADNVWVAEGGSPIGLPVTMTVVRSSKKNDDSLCIFSPLEPQEHSVQAISELGTVKHLVVVHLGHDSWSGAWAKLFPDAKVVSCTVDEDVTTRHMAKKGVEVKGTTMQIAKQYGFKVHESPENSMKRGVREEIYELRGDNKTSMLLLGDQQVHLSLSPRTRAVFSFMQYSGFYQYQRQAILYQAAFVKDPAAQRAWMEEVLPSKVENLACIIFSHGGPLEADDPAKLWGDLRRGASTILG